MKVKHTQNGNVKITLTLDEAGKLRKILRHSSNLELDGFTDTTHEEVSWAVFLSLRDADVAEA
jgi:hypothetical protein